MAYFPIFPNSRVRSDWRVGAVTGGEEVEYTCCYIRFVNFFSFFKTSTLQLGMVEHLKVRENCHEIENNFFQFIHKI